MNIFNRKDLELPNGEYLCYIDNIFYDGTEIVFCIDICKGKYAGYFNEEEPCFLHFTKNDSDAPLELAKIVNAVRKANPDFSQEITLKNYMNLVGQEIKLQFFRGDCTLFDTVERKIVDELSRLLKVIGDIVSDIEWLEKSS